MDDQLLHHNDTIITPATLLDDHGNERQGELLLSFNWYGEPRFSWRDAPPEPPTVEEELGMRPKGSLRWTAFHTDGKLLTVVLVDTAYPFGVWWLGRAETLEQAENIFRTYMRARVSLGPSKSRGEYGI